MKYNTLGNDIGTLIYSGWILVKILRCRGKKDNKLYLLKNQVKSRLQSGLFKQVIMTVEGKRHLKEEDGFLISKVCQSAF